MVLLDRVCLCGCGREWWASVNSANWFYNDNCIRRALKREDWLRDVAEEFLDVRDELAMSRPKTMGIRFGRRPRLKAE